MPASFERLQVIDSHTAGEPTRIVVGGAPDVGTGSMAERREILRRRCDWLRTAVILEPRGSDVLVGGLLCEPVDPACAAGVVFFNNAGYLNMCGHGAIGLAETLRHMGRIGAGRHRIETPVGEVGIEVAEDGAVTLENVESYRLRRDVVVDVPGHGAVRGDVAWGGNWFFLSSDHGFELTLDRVEELTAFTWRLRQALPGQGIAGENGAEIDHIELIGPPSGPDADARNFVLCPGKAYDRSPCGTGTSAKLACLAEDGRLAEGRVWRQESIVGSLFEGEIARRGSRGIVPRVRGRAYVTAEATLLLRPDDPFRYGIGAR